YLAIRGETERALLNQWAQTTFEPKGRLFDFEKSPKPSEERINLVKGVAGEVVTSWLEAEAGSVAVAGRPEMRKAELVHSRGIGKKLFQGTKANCFNCHGISALGDGQNALYDKWTEEFITPKGDPALIREFTRLGMLQPRNLKPRNLRQGVYRGGRRPVDL